jgi:hypothetical protein
VQQKQRYVAPHNTGIPCRHPQPQEPAMYQQFNDQLTKSTRQFADTSAQVGRLALENTEAVFGLQLATIEENMNATFAFWGQLAEARDFDALKAVWPKGVQVARENVERSIGADHALTGAAARAIAHCTRSQRPGSASCRVFCCLKRSAWKADCFDEQHAVNQDQLLIIF